MAFFGTCTALGACRDLQCLSKAAQFDAGRVNAALHSLLSRAATLP